MDELKKMLQLNIEEISSETVTTFEKKRILRKVLKKKRFRSFSYLELV